MEVQDSNKIFFETILLILFFRNIYQTDPYNFDKNVYKGPVEKGRK